MCSEFAIWILTIISAMYVNPLIWLFGNLSLSQLRRQLPHQRAPWAVKKGNRRTAPSVRARGFRRKNHKIRQKQRPVRCSAQQKPRQKTEFLTVCSSRTSARKETLSVIKTAERVSLFYDALAEHSGGALVIPNSDARPCRTENRC